MTVIRADFQLVLIIVANSHTSCLWFTNWSGLPFIDSKIVQLLYLQIMPCMIPMCIWTTFHQYSNLYALTLYKPDLAGLPTCYLYLSSAPTHGLSHCYCSKMFWVAQMKANNHFCFYLLYISHQLWLAYYFLEWSHYMCVFVVSDFEYLNR